MSLRTLTLSILSNETSEEQFQKIKNYCPNVYPPLTNIKSVPVNNLCWANASFIVATSPPIIRKMISELDTTKHLNSKISSLLDKLTKPKTDQKDFFAANEIFDNSAQAFDKYYSQESELRETNDIPSTAEYDRENIEKHNNLPSSKILPIVNDKAICKSSEKGALGSFNEAAICELLDYVYMQLPDNHPMKVQNIFLRFCKNCEEVVRDVPRTISGYFAVNDMGNKNQLIAQGNLRKLNDLIALEGLRYDIFKITCPKCKNEIEPTRGFVEKQREAIVSFCCLTSLPPVLLYLYHDVAASSFPYEGFPNIKNITLPFAFLDKKGNVKEIRKFEYILTGYFIYIPGHFIPCLNFNGQLMNMESGQKFESLTNHFCLMYQINCKN